MVQQLRWRWTLSQDVVRIFSIFLQFITDSCIGFSVYLFPSCWPCYVFTFLFISHFLDEELQLSFDFSLVFCVFPFARFFDGSFDKTVSQRCDMQMSVARIANCSLSIPDQFVSSIYTRLVLFCSMTWF